MYVSVSERFIKCIDFLLETRRLRNQAELVKMLDLSKGYVSQILTGKREPSRGVVESLCELFPGLNKDWILTGAGDMSASAPEASADHGHLVPLLPVFAQAGSLTGWSEGVEEAKCEKVISPVRDVDMAVHVYGESMYPDIPNGSVVYVRRVSGRIIDFGHAYILDTVDGPVLKYIAPGSDGGHVRCVSANPDPKFAPYEVPKEDILGMYRVVMCMRMM